LQAPGAKGPAKRSMNLLFSYLLHMMPFCDSVLGNDFAGVHSVGSEINKFVYASKSAL
jgi:hypothetical protein